MTHGATTERHRLRIDFTGARPRPVAASNLNANPAIVKAATRLCPLRCLIAEDVPLNEGVFEPVDLVIPAPSILAPPDGADPATLAAVNAGNVETSQRLVDVLFGAFGVVAASQGTMNNVLFGRAPDAAGAGGFGYYETICGGAGAGRDFAGASAVHTHMTNTRITDPEVLEWRFPVRLETFAIRRGSGGAGRWRGGDGVLRRLRFLEAATASILSGRRKIAPHGLDGGGPGVCGVNSVERAGGEVEALGGCDSTDMAPGDVLVIETPGGGGYGGEPVT